MRCSNQHLSTVQRNLCWLMIRWWINYTNIFWGLCHSPTEGSWKKNSIIWLVVSTTLKHVQVSWDDEIPEWESKSHIPNHQPENGVREGFWTPLIRAITFVPLRLQPLHHVSRLFLHRGTTTVKTRCHFFRQTHTMLYVFSILYI